MEEKEIDKLISAAFTTVLFFICLCFYFAVTDGKKLDLDNTIIYTYIVIPVSFFNYCLIGKLKLNILNDICKLF